MLGTMERLLGDYEDGRMTRRQLVGRLVTLAVAAPTLGHVALAENTSDSTFTASALNHVALRVTDIPRSRDFYRKHLGLRVRSESSRSCFLDCGENFVALFKSARPGLHHYCYTIDNYTPGSAVELLQQARLDPQRTENRVYFDDPDGLTVQVSAP